MLCCLGASICTLQVKSTPIECGSAVNRARGKLEQSQAHLLPCALSLACDQQACLRCDNGRREVCQRRWVTDRGRMEGCRKRTSRKITYILYRRAETWCELGLARPLVPPSR